MAVNVIGLEEHLKETGNRLLNPPSSVDELLNLLDKLEHLLIDVDQAPSRSMQDALLPPMKALISSNLLRHLETDVRISVASCISEITRITAPDAPYNDEHMKEIFKLILEAFEKLVHESSRCYSKAVSILDTVAKVRSCLMMLDLELDGLIVNMFQNFLKFIRSHHPHGVFLAMETIMSLVIDESEDLPLDLLTPLLTSVRNENKNVSPIAWKLGEKVMTNCASKLKPYLKNAVEHLGVSLENYPPIVTSICQEVPQTFECDSIGYSGDKLIPKELIQADAACPGEVFQAVGRCQFSAARESTPSTRNAIINDSTSKMLEDYSNAEPDVKLVKQIETVRKKRGRKPNSVMNPEEGDDNPLVHTKKLAKLHCERTHDEKGTDNSPIKRPVSVVLSLPHADLSQKGNEVLGASSPSLQQSSSNLKRGRPKKENVIKLDANQNSVLLSKGKFLGGSADDRASEYDDVRLKMVNHGRSNSAAKQPKRFKKIGLTTKNDKETSLTPDFVVSEKKFGVHSDSSLSTKVRGRPKGNSSLSAQAVARENSSVIGSSDADAAESSSEKETKLSNGDRRYQGRTPKTKLKRKLFPKKAFENPDFGFQLIGIKIKVWWPQDKTFYEGVVDSYDPVKKKHKVLYADGDEEKLNLRRERWQIIEDTILPDKGQVSEHDTPSEMLQKGKPKAKVKLDLDTQPKADSSLNRSRAAGASMSKARKSGSTSTDSGRHYTIVGIPMSELGSSAKDDGKVSSFTLKIKGPKPPKKSKPMTPEMPKSPSKVESRANENESCNDDGTKDRKFQQPK